MNKLFVQILLSVMVGVGAALGLNPMSNPNTMTRIETDGSNLDGGLKDKDGSVSWT